MNRILFWVILSCFVGACSPVLEAKPGAVTLTNTITNPSSTPEPTQTPLPPTASPLPPTYTATTVLPSVTPLPACVTLIYGENAQFEIVDPLGQRVLVDVHDPERLSKPAVDRDILLTTHTHWDHVNEKFLADFPGDQLFVREGRVELPGGRIQGIASAHNASDQFKPAGGTNYIYLIELGGLRIAHFGDIGQNTLTADQLALLGEIDIALTQLNNSYSGMNAENGKGIHLIGQLQPRLVIPTHVNLDTMKLAISQWPGFYADGATFEICAADLGESTQLLLMGEAAETMINYLELKKWGNQ